jgi:transposase
MFYDNKRHDPKVQEWCYRLMNDPNQYERWRYTDTIRDYSSIIAGLQKQYDKTPASDHLARARILSGMKRAKTELTNTLAEYEMFKKYKMRTAIKK